MEQGERRRGGNQRGNFQGESDLPLWLCRKSRILIVIKEASCFQNSTPMGQTHIKAPLWKGFSYCFLRSLLYCYVKVSWSICLDDSDFIFFEMYHWSSRIKDSDT